MEGYENDESRILKDHAPKKLLPPGNPMSEENSLGDILQSWNFLWCFHEVLGLKRRFSLDEIAREFTGMSSEALFDIHILLLRVLLSDFQIKSQHSNRKRVSACSTETWSKIDLSILNELTWSELARRYVLAFVLTGGDFDSTNAHEDIDVFHCLHGDGGRFCGSLTGIVGLEVDTWLLAVAANTIYGSLNNNDDILAIDDMDYENGSACQSISVNERIPDWVQELETVVNLRTNVGSQIKKCIQNSIEKCPPTWAMEALEISISKEVYNKANNCGNTKNIALNVVRRFHNMQRTVSICKKRRKFISISDIVLKQCRIVLRRTTTAFIKLFREKSVDYGDEGGPIGSPYLIPRPLDFRAIDMKLATGAYSGSHQAFLEDVRELWRNLPIRFHKLAEDFELSYNKDVVAFLQKLVNHNKLELLSADLRKDVENVLHSVTKMDNGLCKICGIDENDTRVLLCDTEKCNEEYHTYCLSPPLAKVPQYDWFCPRCVADEDIPRDASPSSSSLVYQLLKKNKEESMNLILNETAALAAMLQEREYWDLDVHERTQLLKFFCNEMLSSSPIQNYFQYMDSKKSPKSSLGSEFLGFDSVGRMYWILESGSSPWVVVGESDKFHQYCSTCQDSKLNCLMKDFESTEVSKPCNSNISEITCPHNIEEICCATTSKGLSWVCYQSDAEIKSLLVFLEDEQRVKGKLDLVLKRYKLRLHGIHDSTSQYMKDLQSPFAKLEKTACGLNNLKTKATEQLESKYGPFVKIETTMLLGKGSKKGKKVVDGPMYRCQCLEPVLPNGLHCFYCHKTCITKKEFRFHGEGICDIEVMMPLEIEEMINTLKGKGQYVSVDEFFKGAEKGNKTLLSQKADVELKITKCFKVPISSQRQLTDKACDILEHLKANLLDIEAALPLDAVRSSKACSDKRQAWRAFAKSARTIYEMVQAIIVLEYMIKPEYIDITWRHHWSSISASASISTLAALSLRVYSLDAAIYYKEKRQEDSTRKTHSKMNKKMKEQVMP